MRRKIVELLRRANLREEEIKIYVLLLKLQSATLPELTFKSGLPNITTYRSIQSLIERGIVQSKPLNKKQSVFMPLTLSSLVKTLEKEQKTLRSLELSLRNLDCMLPYINEESKNENIEESVEITSGEQSFHEQYLALPEKGNDEFLAMGSSDMFWKASGASIDSNLERSFVSRRLRKNVYSRVLMVDTDDAEKIASNDSREKRTSRLKPNLPVMKDMLMLCGDQLSHFICDPKNPRVIKIRDPKLVEIHRRFFESLWDM